MVTIAPTRNPHPKSPQNYNKNGDWNDDKSSKNNSIYDIMMKVNKWKPRTTQKFKLKT